MKRKTLLSALLNQLSKLLKSRQNPKTTVRISLTFIFRSFHFDFKQNLRYLLQKMPKKVIRNKNIVAKKIKEKTDDSIF